MEEKQDNSKKKIKDALIEYSHQDYYPFHMPGHKQNEMGDWMSYQTDITEISGFDNLHHPTGLLKEAQIRAAKVYGARESFFLVNGSTAGILAAITVAAQQSEEIILARNSHKSAYHGCSVEGLKVHYLWPEVVSLGINNGISPKQVETIMQEHPNAKTVMITSPTYDGVVSDIEKISEIVHQRGGILIVDCAHGAHFGFHPYFPESPVKLGADLVIMSMHKTMPAPTQTALLHICSPRIDAELVREALDIYQTSSPSYLLMAGLDQAICLVEEKGEALFSDVVKYLADFYEQAKKWRHFCCSNSLLEQGEVYDLDCSKILIFTQNTGEYKGQQLFRQLDEEFHLQLEMFSLDYVTALCSCMDRKEGFERLVKAVNAIENALIIQTKSKVVNSKMFYPRTRAILSIQETKKRKKIQLDLEASEGYISGEYIYLYPPGIPILVPGEQISKEILQAVDYCKQEKMEIQGLSDHKNTRIKVVK